MNQSNVTSLQPTPSDSAAAASLRVLIPEAIDSDPSLSQARIAREIDGVSSATLSQWLSGSYNGDNAKVEAKLAAWYESYQERRKRAGLPEAPEFFETPSASRIIAGLRYGQLAQDLVCVYGPPGVSKSHSCRQYTRMAPGVYMATMTPATKGVMGALQEIATACGMRDLPGSASGLQSRIVSKLAGTNGMLIIDECQHLNAEALEQIRSLFDRCLIGMALVGNEYVYSRMSKEHGPRAAFLLTLKSRVGRYVALRASSDADIDALIAAWKIADKSCHELIRDIGRRPGSLRKLTKVLRLAASFAHAKERPLGADDVRAAWRELGAVE